MRKAAVPLSSVEDNAFHLLCRGACPHAQVWIEIAAEDSRLYTKPVAWDKTDLIFYRKFGIGRFIKESKSFAFPSSQFFKYYLDVLKPYEHATRKFFEK
jgi:hypothetical protein